MSNNKNDTQKNDDNSVKIEDITDQQEDLSQPKFGFQYQARATLTKISEISSQVLEKVRERLQNIEYRKIGNIAIAIVLYMITLVGFIINRTANFINSRIADRESVNTVKATVQEKIVPKLQKLKTGNVHINNTVDFVEETLQNTSNTLNDPDEKLDEQIN